MRKLVFLFVALLNAAVFAQDLPAIAVYATGNIVYDDAKAVAKFMTAALISSGRYRGVERPDDFIAELNDELLMAEQGGENPVSRVGRRFGVRYVCIAEVTPLVDAYQISAYIMDVETAGAVLSGKAVSAVRTAGDLSALSESAVKNMLQIPAAPQVQAAPQIQAAPESAAPDVSHSAPTVSETPAEAKPVKADKKKELKKETEQRGSYMSVGVGGIITGDFGGGVIWASGDQMAMPYYGGGGYLFFDATYAEIFAGYSKGNGKWVSGNVSNADILPDMRREYVNVGLFAKYPFDAGAVTYFPLVGVDYDLSISGEIIPADGDSYKFDGKSDRRGKRPGANALSAVWFRGGGGVDVGFGGVIYLRAEALYGWRMANKYETDLINNRLGDNFSGKFKSTLSGHGLTLKIGLGFKL